MGSVTNLQYHLVLTTKYLRLALQGIEQSVYDAFREVEKASDFKIIEMNIEDGNHIRLALKMSPRYSVSSMVDRIKGLTTHLVWERESQHLSCFYRGKKRVLWTEAYFCSTMGDVSNDIVLRYIRKQNGSKEANLWHSPARLKTSPRSVILNCRERRDA